MIDLTNEKVISLTEGTAILPRRRGAKKPHVSTLYRWAKRGVKGVFLETIQVGGTLCTSLEALQRFCNRLSHSPAAGLDRTENPITSARRLAEAEEKLDRLGI